MKTFKTFLSEALGDYQSSAGLSSEKIPYDIEDADVKAKINAILGHVAVSEFLNPKAAVAQMEAKLALLGLQRAEVPSDDPRNEVADILESDSGEFDLPFKLHGDIIGKSVDTPIDELDEDQKLVSLKVRFEKLDTGSFKVYGSLV
jgi:hypothetical protein